MAEEFARRGSGGAAVGGHAVGGQPVALHKRISDSASRGVGFARYEAGTGHVGGEKCQDMLAVLAWRAVGAARRVGAVRARRAIIPTGRSASSSALPPAAATTCSRAWWCRNSRSRPARPRSSRTRPARAGASPPNTSRKQPADGYTVLVGATGQMSIAAAIYPNLGYHPTKSFIPLNMIASFPLVLVVPANHPVKTVKELVEWAKAHPDKSNYGTSSPAFTIATRVVQAEDRHAGVAIPLQEQQRVELVRDQRSVPVHDLGRPAGDPAGQGRQDARAGGDRFGALARTARRAEHGRGRLSGASTRICGAASSCRPARRSRSSPNCTRISARRSPTRACRTGLKKMAVTPGGPTGDGVRQAHRRRHRQIRRGREGGASDRSAISRRTIARRGAPLL